jgi:hypothetical protein
MKLAIQNRLVFGPPTMALRIFFRHQPCLTHIGKRYLSIIDPSPIEQAASLIWENIPEKESARNSLLQLLNGTTTTTTTTTTTMF